jgi:hypothetical protein
MALSVARLRASVARSRKQAQLIAVAAFGAIVFLILGLNAHRRATAERVELGALTTASDDIARFRAAFRASTPERDAAMVSLPDSLAVFVQSELRTTLAQNIAARGELVGLSGMRVKFAAIDSEAPTSVPDLPGNDTKVADFTISLDCDGSFSALLSLVSHLPPSVALQRLSAMRGPAGTHFHLTLAVFEASGLSQHG